MSTGMGQRVLPPPEPTMALRKQHRLRRSEDFARLRKEGRVTRHPMLLVSTAPNGLAHNRYGFVTPKRLGKAVQRNRVRRLLREAVRLLHPHLLQGQDVAVIARRDAVGASYDLVQRAVHKAFRRAGLLRDEDLPAL